MGRKWGQHFLRSQAVIEKIIKAGKISATETILEIGPGEGVLTYEMCRQAGAVHVFEIDPELAEKLRQSGVENLFVHQGDFLEAELETLRTTVGDAPVTVVANLPYYITAPILQRLLWQRPLPIRRAVLMMQDEVARRVCGPASKEAGAITYFANAFFHTSYLFKVPPGSFSPPPKVNSAVILASPSDMEPPTSQQVKFFERIVATVFRTRRKQLARSLRAITPEPTQWLEQSEIDPKRRPETLTVQEFWRLARNCPHCE